MNTRNSFVFRGAIAMALIVSFDSGPMDAAKPAAGKPVPGADRVIAIDVLLEPDAEMVERSVAVNARLRKNYRKGYTLGKVHVPHITLVQRYVRERDLKAIGDAVAKVCADAKPLDWELRAMNIGYGMWSGLAITVIDVERTDKLRHLHDAIVKAIESFAVDAGTAAAFARSEELPEIDETTIAYVKNFVPNSSGDKYNPHVTVGVAPEDFVKKLKAEPFEKFSFKVSKVAIHQLGDFGTAQKSLWQWNEGGGGRSK